MQDVAKKKVTRLLRVGNIVDKQCARCVYDVINKVRTPYEQDVPDLIHNLCQRVEAIRKRSSETVGFVTMESCLKVGFFVRMNGKTTFRLKMPERLNRRWKVVCNRSIAVGMLLAQGHFKEVEPS